MSRLPDLLSELKRRRVFRVAGIYLVAGWVAIQAAATIFPILELPAWTSKLVVALTAVGLPVALALAWAFDVTPEGVRGTGVAGRDDGLAPSTAAGTLRRRAWLGLLALLLTTGGWFAWSRRAAGPTDAAADVVAVLPFRVAGAEPSLAYLREGMVDLLAATLTGEGGPRAVDARTMLAAWRRAAGAEEADLAEADALGLAGRVGAGRVLLGEVVGTPERLVLTARLLDAAGRARPAEARVDGPADSLAALVDRLAVQILALGAAESAQHAASLTTTSLPALRAFLAGRAAHRLGRDVGAARHFEEALVADSAFALAAVHLADLRDWMGAQGPSGQGRRAVTLAWAARDRLSPRDRAYLEAIAGPRFPEPPSLAEMIAAAERAVRAAPDRPESWLRLGDALFHYGALAGLPDALLRARPAFARALALDSTYVDALQHLLNLAVLDGDTAFAAHAARRMIALDSAGPLTNAARWHLARAERDTAALGRLRERFAEFDGRTLTQVYLGGQQDPSALEDAGLAAAVQAAATPGNVRLALSLHDFALNRGRPAEALGHLGHGARTPDDRRLALRVQLHGALFWDGDTAAAGQAAVELAHLAAAPAQDMALRQEALDEALALELWTALRGSPASEPGYAAERLERAVASAGGEPGGAGVRAGALLLEALHAARAGRPVAAGAGVRVDSLLRTGPPGLDLLSLHAANLLVARLLEAQGDHAGALAAVRRRHFPSPILLSAMLREEARLADRMGDRQGAVRAYEHYLALRSDPEPAVHPEVERVRAELTALVVEAGAR
jgi:TolB-like protein